MMTHLKPWHALGIHLILLIFIGGIVAIAVGQDEALTLCAGGAVSLLTLGGVVWTTHRMIAKKPIALTTLSIVIKYAFLGWILYYLTLVLKMNILWLGVGVSLILPSLIIFGLLSETGLNENEVD